MKERRLELIREIIRHEIIETQDELAAQLRKRRIAVTQATVSKWESGDTNFTLSTLVHIASKLGLKMQTPFEPKERKEKRAPVRAANIVNFSEHAGGKSAISGSVNSKYWSAESDELKEM